ncbi:hypothetical protein M427DRAFT_69514 [Gonapodya prolifera JEL478]|uniref:Gated mechanosensitive channel n=1 Tax=Gonapodya prolifera (strain JEL478) TaxID=1344416 RepID=A0A139AH98_GONPJ|nr:hypothetical protein M427DRAFT_69514 [Gonapodya prolifera JEL478]|eukprot:KXS16192.1 hypothetical protein M427DRAFT_69514 [Gonapodya prolifera JEL478]
MDSPPPLSDSAVSPTTSPTSLRRNLSLSRSLIPKSGSSAPREPSAVAHVRSSSTPPSTLPDGPPPPTPGAPSMNSPFGRAAPLSRTSTLPSLDVQSLTVGYLESTETMWRQWRRFKEFVTSARVIEVAIGNVIGDTLKEVVKSFVADVILPPLAWIVGNRLQNQFIVLARGRSKTLRYQTVEQAMADGAVTLNYGRFQNTVFNFWITGLAAYYCLQVAQTFFRRYLEPGTRECPFCCSNIPKRASKCSQCASSVEPVREDYGGY